MNFLASQADLRRAAFTEHVGPEAVARFNDPRPITLEELRELRMNSWERKFLLKKLDDETLLAVIQHCLDNCQSCLAGRHEKPCVTYDESLTRELLPELLNRKEFRKLVP